MNDSSFQRDPFARRSVIWILVTILLFWSAILGVGAALKSGWEWVKPAVIVGVMATFAAIWLVALTKKTRSPSPTAREKATPGQEFSDRNPPGI